MQTESKKPFFPMELNECLMKFEHRQEKYGDSWKTMMTFELRDRLKEEIGEWMREDALQHDSDESCKELVDIINISLMLLWRRRND